MSVRALYRIVPIIAVTGAVFAMADVASATGYLVERSENTASATMRYKVDLYKTVQMQPVFISSHDFHYLGQSPPPYYYHQWNVSLLVLPSGGQAEPVFGKVYWKDGGAWTHLIDVPGVWQP